MAKRKRVREQKLVQIQRIQNHSCQPSTQLPTKLPQDHHSPSKTTKYKVRLAHHKHQHDSDKTVPHPTLATHFNALPNHIRTSIFALLLTQPVRWNLTHNPSTCLMHTSSPSLHPPAPLPGIGPRCRYCANAHHRATAWASRRPHQIWVSALRSAWAPKQSNPYLCTRCYETRFPHPLSPKQGERIPCLCARRENLQVLLVCRNWYAEAGEVFYAANTFAFQRVASFVEFVQFLPARWRPKVSKVSLMAYPAGAGEVAGAKRLSLKLLRRAGHELRFSLPSLAVLELDVGFLGMVDVVPALGGPGLRNLRELVFVERAGWRELGVPGDWGHWARAFVWPEMAGRWVCRGGVVEGIARRLKGKKRGLRGGGEGEDELKGPVRSWESRGVVERYGRVVDVRKFGER